MGSMEGVVQRLSFWLSGIKKLRGEPRRLSGGYHADKGGQSVKVTIHFNSMSRVKLCDLHGFWGLHNFESSVLLGNDSGWHPKELLNDMIYLTATGFTAGGSNTINIYTQTIHRQHNRHKQYTEQHISVIRKSPDRAPSLRGIPWHLPYNWGKSTEKPQSG